ncbi:MAG: hypothetical protein HQ517_18070 [SAR324 cluster bacterium]|nr:hypothetical protein [SAR324 cluster bacterium]
MYKIFKLMAVALAVIASSLFVNQVHAQGNLTPTQEFSQWRAGIPDYEKRLYDRIKSLNKRTVRIQSTIIIGFVVLFLFMMVLYIRQKGGASNVGHTSKSSRLILENQRVLMDILSDLMASEYVKKSESEDFSKIMESSKIQLVKLQEQIALQEKIQIEDNDKSAE